MSNKKWVKKYCKGNKGTLAKFDVVFWLYTESADDRKPLISQPVLRRSAIPTIGSFSMRVKSKVAGSGSFYVPISH